MRAAPDRRREAALALAAAALLVALLAGARGAEREAAPKPEGAPEGAAGLLFGRPLDPNRAAAADLEALPAVGPGRAAAIVAARADGPFCRVEALRRVRGIGPRTLEAAAPGLAVRDAPPGCGSPGRAPAGSDAAGRDGCAGPCGGEPDAGSRPPAGREGEG